MSDKIKFVYLNLCDQDSTVVTGSTEDPFYPASNLKDARTTKKWRTTSSSGSVVFDFITTEAVDSLMVRGDAFTGRGFNSTLTIEANTTDSWGSPAYSTTLSFSDKHNIGFKFLDSDESYRFWRVSGSGSSYLELSNICIGKSLIPERNISTRLKFEEIDLSDRTENDDGQEWFIERNRKRKLSCDIKFLSKAGIDYLMTMFDAVGISKPIWVVPDNAEFFSPEKERFASQYRLRKVPSYNHSIKGLYNIDFDLNEVI